MAILIGWIVQAVLYNVIRIENFDIMECFANQIYIVVKNSVKFNAVSFVKHKVCNCCTKAACTNKNSIDMVIRKKQMFNFTVEKFYAVTDTLLAKTAKTVKVLGVEPIRSAS